VISSILGLGLLDGHLEGKTDGANKVGTSPMTPHRSRPAGMGPRHRRPTPRDKILLIPGVSDADVPHHLGSAVNQSMISEEGKMKLGLI